MTETAIYLDDAADTDTADREPTLAEILDAPNVADLLDEHKLHEIGQRCVREFEYDWESTKEWRERYKRWMDVAMQVKEAKNHPWPKAANLKFPILTTAVIQFWARAVPAIIDGANLVKGRVLGPDPDGVKAARAERMGQHMTWQFLYDMPAWEDDTDKLLLLLPIVGCVIRKTYYDAIEHRNESEIVSADDFVINYWSSSLLKAPRFTHVLRRYPYQVEENVRSGLWYDVQLPTSTNEKDGSDTAPIEFLEQHCRIDLDGDGYPEPYVVTLVRETGEVCRIAACFDAEGVKAMRVRGHNVVQRIERKQYFTKYGFLPSPDGSFYDRGFGQILDDITGGIDTILNQSLDAATLQNTQGGFIGSGINIKSGPMRMAAGEWKRVDVTGGTLRDNIFPLELPGPSAVLFNLLELLIGAAEKITSSSDALSGESSGTEQPTTLLARIQQATKVMTGIFKRIHRAFGQEIAIMRDLNKDFLEDQVYFNLTDTPGQIGRADYEDKDLDVIPVSDPTSVNDAEKAAKANSLMVWIRNPLVNQQEIARRYMEATGQRDIGKLLDVAPPPPDPKILIEGAKLALEKMKVDALYDQQKATGVKQLIDAAVAAAGIGLIDDAAMFAGAAQKLSIESTQYTLESPNGQPVDRQADMGGVALPRGNEGVLQPPAGPPPGADGSMGAGNPDGPEPSALSDGPAPAPEPLA